MSGTEDSGNTRRRRFTPGLAANREDNGLLRRITRYFRKRAREEGHPVLQVQDAPGDLEELAQRIMKAVAERRDDPSSRTSAGPIIVEIVGDGTIRRRALSGRRPPALQEDSGPLGTTAVTDDLVKGDAKAIRGGEHDWRAYRRYVDGLEREAREDPEAALERAMERLENESTEAREQMAAFGIEVEPEDRPGPPRRWREVEGSKDLSHPRGAAAFGDAWWRFTANNDARARALVVSAEARERGDVAREGARASCEEIVRVLRGRPLLYGVLAIRPPFRGAGTRGLERARAYFAATFAGWVKLEISLQANKRLNDAFKVEGKPNDVFLRELSAEVLVEYRQLMQEAEAEPERAMRELTHEDLGRRVRRALERRGSRKPLPGRAFAKLRVDATNPEDAAIEEFVTKETARQDLNRFKAWVEEAKKTGELKGKQLRVCELALAGHATADIARMENMAESTVRQHRKRALDKARKALGA